MMSRTDVTTESHKEERAGLCIPVAAMVQIPDNLAGPFLTVTTIGISLLA